MVLTPVATLLALAALADAHLGHHAHVARRFASREASSETWWHRDDNHFAHKLFKRGPATDGVTYPQVGSPAWTAAYPALVAAPTGGYLTPDSNAMPQEWKDALAAAVAAGKIPNVPVSIPDPNGGSPTYPGGVDPMSPDVCSTTPKCRLDKNIIWDAPDGQVGVSFDDGPVPGSSDTLYAFLQQNNIPATHFFIGAAILGAPKEFLAAFNNGGDIAVHTWTHPHMTTKSSLDVVAELGYTMQIIHDSTGGRIPRFWRPPTGDSDNRINAIAREVFGLKTVIWNQDTEDWSMATTSLTVASVENSLHGWYAGPKSPGLIILEHELTNDTVGAFINTWPSAVQAGWKAVSVAQLDGQNMPYQNAQGQGQPTVDDVVLSPASASSSTSLGVSTTVSVNNNAAKTSSAAGVTQSPNSAAAAKNGTASDATTHSGAARFEASSMLAALSTLVMSAVIATL